TSEGLPPDTWGLTLLTCQVAAAQSGSAPPYHLMSTPAERNPQCGLVQQHVQQPRRLAAPGDVSIRLPTCGNEPHRPSGLEFASRGSASRRGPSPSSDQPGSRPVRN